MKIVIGLTGFAQSGKDTVAKFLVEGYGFERVAFADPLREMLYQLNPEVTIGNSPIYNYPGATCSTVRYLVDKHGWEDAKVKFPKIRELLQRLGTDAGRNVLGENIWVDAAMKKAAGLERVVFTDARFQNELDAIRSVRGKVFRVLRPGIKPVNTHISDAGISSLIVDGEIFNSGYLDDLKYTVDQLAVYIGASKI